LPDGNLLEIGVGNGAYFHRYKKHKIIAIDTSKTMIEIARKRNNPTVKLIQMDGKELRFNNEQFDYVVLSHVIAVVDDPEKLFEEVRRVLKPEGKVLILNHFTPNSWLKYVDRAFAAFSKVFHFKSVFYIDEINAIKKFTLLKEISFSSLSYFKLLIYQKK